MAATGQKYVCKISVRDKNNKTIPAGTAFSKGQLKDAGFKSLEKGGYLRPADQPEVIDSTARELVSVPEVTGTQKAENGPRALVKGKTVPDLGISAGKKVTAEGVWKNDPKDLEVYDFAVLMSAYQETCEKFELVPTQFKPEDKAALVAEMSKDFVPEDGDNK